MKKLSNDFNKVNGAQKVVLKALKTYTERAKQDRELALLRHDKAWETEKRRYQPKPLNDFRYGVVTPRLTPREYHKLRSEYLLRRKAINDHHDELAKEIQRVKDLVRDGFNQPARGSSIQPKRPKRERSDGRQR